MRDKFASRKFLATIGFGLIFVGLVIAKVLTGDQFVSLMQFILPAFVFAQAYQDVKAAKFTNIKQKVLQRPPKMEDY